MNKNTFLIELSEGPRTDFGRIDFNRQSPVQRVFSTIWALESEVNSGGFSHYFSSSEKDTAPFAPAALRTVGAQKCAAIVEAALQAGAADDLSALDKEFMAYPDNLTDLLFNYVASHPDVFGAVGQVA